MIVVNLETYRYYIGRIEIIRNKYCKILGIPG
jgi:hypothetical protein